jgi:serine protease AprX
MPKRSIDERLSAGVISVPLASEMARRGGEPAGVIIELNRRKPDARERVAEAAARSGARMQMRPSRRYVYLSAGADALRHIAETATAAIHRIWPDFRIHSQIMRSAATIKADACRRAFRARGQGIVWAVVDSGIDGSHPHFSAHGNLRELPPLAGHMDFTADSPRAVEPGVLEDADGHGTHVAGILAGGCGEMQGIAPETKLVSYRVLTGDPEGDPVSNVIAALEHIQEVNAGGRALTIHGVNLSLGHEFDPEWFACGQSPLCTEVNHLARSGVVVVAAAGNTGLRAPLSIQDPGNSELAITAGATHRDMPYTYGVSYFSSKGPTGDGRRKPDLVAPGERIVSCGAGGGYVERSGTSMAAAHVSGVVAGILSVRPEFIGQAERVKELVLASCQDLGRDPAFQGRGLIDMMRALQSL